MRSLHLLECRYWPPGFFARTFGELRSWNALGNGMMLPLQRDSAATSCQRKAKFCRSRCVLDIRNFSVTGSYVSVVDGGGSADQFSVSMPASHLAALHQSVKLKPIAGSQFPRNLRSTKKLITADLNPKSRKPATEQQLSHQQT